VAAHFRGMKGGYYAQTRLVLTRIVERVYGSVENCGLFTAFVFVLDVMSVVSFSFVVVR